MLSLSALAGQRLLSEDLSTTLLARSTSARAAGAILGNLRVTGTEVYQAIVDRLYTVIRRQTVDTDGELLLQTNDPKWLVLIEHDPRILPFVVTVHVNGRHVRAHITYDGHTLLVEPHFVPHLAMENGVDVRVTAFGREIYYMPRMRRESVRQQMSGTRNDTPSRRARIGGTVLQSIHHRHHANLSFVMRCSRYSRDDDVYMLFTRLPLMHAGVTIAADVIADVCRPSAWDTNGCVHTVSVDDDGRLNMEDHGAQPCIMLATVSIPVETATILTALSPHSVKRLRPGRLV